MSSSSSGLPQKRFTVKRIGSILFLLFAGFLFLVGWVMSIMRAGAGPSPNEVLNAIGMSNFVHVALAGSLLAALVGVVLAIFDLADKR